MLGRNEADIVEVHGNVVESHQPSYEKTNFEYGVIEPKEVILKLDDVAVDEEKECCSCPAASPGDNYDYLQRCKPMRLLRFFGTVSIILAFIELGLSATIFNTIANVKNGAWWAGILALIGGAFAMRCRNKTVATITLVLNTSSLAVTAVGAVVDGLSSSLFSNLAASTSYNAERKLTHRYGDSIFFDESDNCLYDAIIDNTFVSNGCYLTTLTGNECYEFTLSTTATAAGTNCGMIMTRYLQILMASVAFCVLLFFCALIISVISFGLICCPERLSKMARPNDEYPPDNVIVGIHGHENTF